jgi:hypothetical protein
LPWAEGRILAGKSSSEKTLEWVRRHAFARSPSPEEKIAAAIQNEAYEQVIYVPLGQFLTPNAWRKSLSGVLDGPATPIFWNNDKLAPMPLMGLLCRNAATLRGGQ